MKDWLQAFAEMFTLFVTLCVIVITFTLLFGTEQQVNNLGLMFLSFRRNLGL